MPYRNQVVMQGFGVRWPQTLVEQVDMARGDVNRSRYLQRLIEKNLNVNVNAIGSEQVLAGASTHPISSTNRKRKEFLT